MSRSKSPEQHPKSLPYDERLWIVGLCLTSGICGLIVGCVGHSPMAIIGAALSILAAGHTWARYRSS